MSSLGAPPESPSTRTRLRWLAVSLGVLVGLAVLTAVGCSVSLGWSWADALDAFVLTNAVMGLAFGGCGALLAWHRPENAIGWLFLVGGLLQAVAAATSPLGELVKQAGASTAALRLTVTVFVYSGPWAIGLCIPLALLLFPDGRPVSRAWRRVVGAVAVTGPLFVLETGAGPEPVSEGDQIGHLTISGDDQLDALWKFAERARRRRTCCRSGPWWSATGADRDRPSESRCWRPRWPWSSRCSGRGQVTGTPPAVLFDVPLIPVAITGAAVRYGLLDIGWSCRGRAVPASLLVVVAYGALVAVLDRVVSAYLSRS